jgi:hypothetical protein
LYFLQFSFNNKNKQTKQVFLPEPTPISSSFLIRFERLFLWTNDNNLLFFDLPAFMSVGYSIPSPIRIGLLGVHSERCEVPCPIFFFLAYAREFKNKRDSANGNVENMPSYMHTYVHMHAYEVFHMVAPSTFATHQNGQKKTDIYRFHSSENCEDEKWGDYRSYAL